MHYLSESLSLHNVCSHTLAFLCKLILILSIFYNRYLLNIPGLNNTKIAVHHCLYVGVTKSSPVTGLEWPTEFQYVKVPRLQDNGTGWW
jgi:hypothetical protein